MASLLLYTDQPVLAIAVSQLFFSVPAIEPVRVCHRLEDLTPLLQELQPDLLLVDLTPDVTFGLLAEVKQALPRCRIVLWVYAFSTEWAIQAISLGIRGILRKTLQPEMLVKCVQKVLDGEVWFEKGLMDSLLTVRKVALTPREGQLMTLLSQGLRNKEIATTLDISEATVKAYLSALYQKVGVSDRFELALYALRNLSGQPVLGLPGKKEPRPADSKQQTLRSLVL